MFNRTDLFALLVGSLVSAATGCDKLGIGGHKDGDTSVASGGDDESQTAGDVWEVEKVGIKVCDDYLDTLHTCFRSMKMPLEARRKQSESYGKLAKSWIDTAKSSPEASQNLAIGCEMMLTAAAASMKAQCPGVFKPDERDTSVKTGGGEDKPKKVAGDWDVESVGIEACDEYAVKVEACFKAMKMPIDALIAQNESAKKQAKSWSDTAKSGPEARATVKALCQTALLGAARGFGPKCPGVFDSAK